MKVPTLFKEYIWLIDTIWKARRITFAEINERWLETEISGGVEMARATFNRHKDAIEDIFGIYIDCDRQDGYRYYIGNSEVLRESTIQNWMLSTLAVSNIVSEATSLQDRILLEPVSSESSNLRKVIEAMKQGVRIKMLYQRYGASVPKEFDMEPYCVKLSDKRWYVLGHFYRAATEEEAEIDYFGIFAFDRIRMLSLSDVKFEVNPEFDAAAYFRDCFGVIAHDATPTERIVIRAYGQQRYYLRDLPIHHSQNEIAHGEDYSDFELNLRPTIDFCNHLLSFGNRIKVLFPQSLANEIHNMHLNAAMMYES